MYLLLIYDKKSLLFPMKHNFLQSVSIMNQDKIIFSWLASKLENTNDYSKMFLWAHKLYFKVMFIWPKKNNYFSRLIGTIVNVGTSMFLTIGLLLYSYKNIDDFNKATNSMIFTTLPAMCIVKVLALWFNADGFIILHDQTKEKFWPYDLVANGKSKYTVRRYFKYNNTAIFVFVVAALLFNPLTALSPLVDPDKTLPFEVYYPFDFSKSPNHELMYCYQVFTMGAIIGITSSSLDFLILNYLLCLSSQYCILEESFSIFNTDAMYEVNRKMREVCKDGLENRYDEKKEYFVRCVRHHQLLLSFSKQLNELLNPFEMCQLTIGVFSFCLGFLRFTSKDVTAMDLIISGVYMIGYVMQLAVDCFLGTFLYYQASLIPDAIFESKWINLEDKGLAKDVLFLLQHSQRIPQLNAYGLYDMHMMSYIKVLRLAFSFYTLLTSLTEK